MKLSCIALGITLALSATAVSAAQSTFEFLDSNQLSNSLEGPLPGTVKFAQTHTIDANGNSQQEMPHLTSSRETLVMLVQHKKLNWVEVRARDKDGKILGRLFMNEPNKLPAADRPGNAPNPDIVYSHNAWSATLPAEWVQPGLNLEFSSNSGIGYLKNIEIGGETQVILQNIRIGMLTPPGPLSNNPLEQQSEAMAKDYFQKIPVSQLIVGNYSPVQLDEVVLSSGKKYHTRSDDTGGVYDGDLRENIGKALISMGIDNANFGVNSSVGHTGWQPGLAHMVAVHQSWGNYINGRVRHGLSGGNGMATLYDTVGNEFSHEIGHTFGMGHYPGGGKYSVHNLNSGWGWDSFNKRFIANIFWDRTGDNRGDDEIITPPFKGIHQFNRDTMGGGHAGSPLSRYTLHTGYTQKRIQQRLEKTGVITPESPTGYLIWDSAQQKMVEASGEYRRKPQQFGVPVTTIMGFYDPQAKLESYVYPAMHGSYGYVYAPQPPKAGECWAEVSYADHAPEKFGLVGTRLNSDHMNKFHINVPTSKKPESVAISCPKMDMGKMFTDWKLKKFNTSRINNWGDKDAALGSIFYYEGPQLYFRLKKTPFWYFPTTAVDNAHWEFVTKESDLADEFSRQLSVLPANYYGEQELTRRHLDAASVEPMPAAVVGKLSGNGSSQPNDREAEHTEVANTDIAPVEPQDKEIVHEPEHTSEPAVTDSEAEHHNADSSEDEHVEPQDEAESVNEPEQASEPAATDSDADNSEVTQVEPQDETESVNEAEQASEPAVTDSEVENNDADNSEATPVDPQEESESVNVPEQNTVQAPVAAVSNIPAYNATIAYPTRCTQVSYKGETWVSQWWINAGQEEPGTGGTWGAWRAVGSQHNACK